MQRAIVKNRRPENCLVCKHLMPPIPENKKKSGAPWYICSPLCKKKRTKELSIRNFESLRASKWRHRGYKERDGSPITETTYQRLLTEQNGTCTLCSNSKNLELDHDHETGKIRGLLCPKHNLGLGIIGDTIESISKVLEYLKKVNSS